jgi:hypothetical protein
MRVRLVGASVTATALRAALRACGLAAVAAPRKQAAVTWVELGDVADASLVDLARRLHAPLTVVEVALGSRGARARSFTLSDERVDGEREHAVRAAVDASVLAWQVVDRLGEPAPQPTPPDDRPERWAANLLDRLIDAGKLELERPGKRPDDRVTRELRRDDDSLGERLLAALVGSPMVAEVYLDEVELAAVAHRCRPKR